MARQTCERSHHDVPHAASPYTRPSPLEFRARIAVRAEADLLPKRTVNIIATQKTLPALEHTTYCGGESPPTATSVVVQLGPPQGKLKSD